MTKPAKSSISNGDRKAKACCQTDLISFFLFSKPHLFTAIVEIYRRKANETKSGYKVCDDTNELKREDCVNAKCI
jgi:hypothetical protein